MINYCLFQDVSLLCPSTAGTCSSWNGNRKWMDGWMETFTCMNQKTCCMLHQLPKSKWDLTKTRSRLLSRGRFYSSISFFLSFCFEVRAHLAQQHTLVTGGSGGDNYTEFLSFILSYLLLLPSLTLNYIPAEDDNSIQFKYNEIILIALNDVHQWPYLIFSITLNYFHLHWIICFSYIQLLSITWNYFRYAQLHSVALIYIGLLWITEFSYILLL